MTGNVYQLPIDLDVQADSVGRRVTIDQRESGPYVEVCVDQVYATTVDDLWDACTSPERLPQWFAPVSGDLVLGGRYQVEGNAGGTVEVCEPPHRFTATWEFAGAVSHIEVLVEAARTATGDDGARLVLIHRADTPADFWKTYGPGATGVGWDLALLGLHLHVTRGWSKPPEMDGWDTGDEAKHFVGRCSGHWGDASIAGGTPQAEARAAQARTTAFYRGEPAPE